MQVNFIEEFNSFMGFAKDNVLSAQERAFWMALFYVCNSWAMRHYNPQTKTADWPDEFIIVTNEEIYLLSNLNKKAILTVRNQLKQRGLIDFKGGVGNTGKKPMYKLRYLSLEVGGKNAPNYAPDYGPDYAPNYAPNYGPNTFPTMLPIARQVSNNINTNNNRDINQRDTHGYGCISATANGARAQYMGMDNQLRPARFDGAFLTSAKARGAIAQRLLQEFDGDQATDDAHAALCELMRWGMPPELIEDAMDGQDSTIGWIARLRTLAQLYGYSDEPRRREMAANMVVAHGNKEFAERLYRIAHPKTEAIEDEEAKGVSNTMKELTEKQRAVRQRKAWEARESIQPRDIVRMKCTYADESLFHVPMKNGGYLMCLQPYDRIFDRPMETVKAGDVLEMWCSAIIVKSNGYGRFVDYEFYCERIQRTVTINGPDAQALEKAGQYPWTGR